MGPPPEARTVREAIAGFLLMGHDAYPTPEDAADGLLKRLSNEGYKVVPVIAHRVTAVRHPKETVDGSNAAAFRALFELDGRMVRIWSGEHQAYWRASGCGYVVDPTIAEIGQWRFEDAFEMTQHCGPEKQIMFEVVSHE